MEEENEKINNTIQNADFIITLFAAIYKEVGKNKPTIKPILSEAFNELGVPKDVVTAYVLSPEDAKLLQHSEKLSNKSKYLLAASIFLDFFDAATVGQEKGLVAQSKRLARNLITTFAVYGATKIGTIVGEKIGGGLGELIGTWVAPGAGTVTGKVIGKIVGGVGGGFLAGYWAQKTLDDFFEGKGW